VKLREIESWGVKLRESEVQGGYFKMGGSSGGSCEISPKSKKYVNYYEYSNYSWEYSLSKRIGVLKTIFFSCNIRRAFLIKIKFEIK
jgi:hypothetical protein